MSSRLACAGKGVRLADCIPRGAWDSHMHVVDARYKLSSTALYTPTPHTLDQALQFESLFGIKNIVLVQPSIYGNDNSCTLDALAAVGPRHGRAVVAIDPNATRPETLKQWHDMGVRGVRLNLKSVGRTPSRTELFAELMAHADMIRPLGWVLQVYLSLDAVQDIEHLMPKLDVKLCIDHFGHPSLPQNIATRRSLDPYTLPGFESLIRLLKGGRTWVKCSAAYRIEKEPEMPSVEIIARELLRVASKRVVFATDWPHTRFEHTDVRSFVEACLRWCENNPDMRERLFRRNAEELWDTVQS
ncbi:uncharacterized protein K452DRAFT_292816 [Aplosporella prunicola CBS 121167]|uniref:Amidohydrolase-related domain-containing protein n=1 Tax=Aplosporella prunicola CBS 121167 TaxID=1176127 RepID=A0A6A6AYW4_9PEZI|nr:uncharacterized protein K452DRAFT_292816 [Aplosporella prunicola CBS 121167]KAF2135957.1 hypothetical protein K452DRAFT_292816 [Aplosporella prunicola CBS 121167]